MPMQPDTAKMPIQLDTDKMPGLPDIADFLKRTISILEQVENTMTQEGPSMQLKFNHDQCNYLADKLRKAVDGANVFSKLLNKVHETPFTIEDMVKFLEIFKLLHAFAVQAGTFIQECCKDSWLVSARKLTNVMEHVLAMIFCLELCAIVFSDRWKWVATLSSLVKPELVDKLIDDEAATIREKALSDKNAMLLQVEAVLDPSSTSGIKEYQLAKQLKRNLKEGSTFEEFEEKDRNSIIQLEMLGAGSYGKVYKGMNGELDIAKKTVSKGTDFLTFKKEVTIQSQMSHSNVLSLHCYTVEKREQSIIMPYMEKSLSTLMDERLKADRECPFTILVAVDIMSQVAWGMHYVHGREIAHRDLKAENILVTLVARTEFVLVKVADFGASKMIMIDEEEGDENEEMRMIDVTPNIGTLRWKAPEQFQPAGTPKEKMPRKDAFIKVAQCDIYSFAMVCYEVLTGKLPYGEFHSWEIKQRILDGERPKLPECHVRLIDLIQRCWSKEAGVRPPFGTICKELEYVRYELLMTFAWGSTRAQSMIENARQNYTSELFTAMVESTRAQRMIENASEFFTATEESEFTVTEETHLQGWSEIQDGATQAVNRLNEDRMVFQDLKLRQDERKAERIRLGLGRDVPGFFQDMDDLVLGRLLAEGAQAYIYEACYAGGKGYVAKVFKMEGFSLEDLLKQMPTGVLNAFERDTREGSPLSLICGATLLKDGRFAVLMQRKWGDLRTLINLRLKGKAFDDPPFTFEEVIMMMFGIAKDMMSLQSESPPILHRDLKATNVLVQSSHESEITEITVCDMEFNLMVSGTGFWRAPEILIELLKRPSNRDIAFSEKSDIYSYGMTCYELATGHIPFEGYFKKDWKRIIEGERPYLPSYVHPFCRRCDH